MVFVMEVAVCFLLWHELFFFIHHVSSSILPPVCISSAGPGRIYSKFDIVDFRQCVEQA